MKTLKYFILLAVIATSFSSCFVGRRGGRGHEMHHDGGDHHDDRH